MASDLFAALARLEIPRIMGVLNVTDDSFSDGGQFSDPVRALIQAKRMIEAGAAIIDIGGESTRPGAEPVPVELELQRVIPVLKAIRTAFPDVLLSVDTRKSAVAAAAIAKGANIINDVSALRFDPELAPLLARHPGVRVILMHMQGEPSTMQQAPHYEDVLAEIADFFAERISFAEGCGISRDRLLLDPGIGFGKNLSHNLTLLANLDQFTSFGLPLVLGASRKRFIDAIEPSGVNERLGGSLAAALCACLNQVSIIRVHDVKQHRQFLQVLQAIAKARRKWDS